MGLEDELSEMYRWAITVGFGSLRVSFIGHWIAGCTLVHSQTKRGFLQRKHFLPNQSLACTAMDLRFLQSLPPNSKVFRLVCRRKEHLHQLALLSCELHRHGYAGLHFGNVRVQEAHAVLIAEHIRLLQVLESTFAVWFDFVCGCLPGGFEVARARSPSCCPALRDARAQREAAPRPCQPLIADIVSFDGMRDIAHLGSSAHSRLYVLHSCLHAQGPSPLAHTSQLFWPTQRFAQSSARLKCMKCSRV